MYPMTVREQLGRLDGTTFFELHLAWLRDELGERFLAGVVLHTGPRAYELEERIRAVPIAALWG